MGDLSIIERESDGNRVRGMSGGGVMLSSRMDPENGTGLCEDHAVFGHNFFALRDYSEGM